MINNPKILFAKLLPTGKEVKRKTGSTVSDEVGKCLRENDNGYDYYQELSMFLCSKDIQIGDILTYEDGTLLKPIISLDSFGLICVYTEGNLKYLREKCFKVIGPISRDVIGVKDGMKFENEQIKFVISMDPPFEGWEEVIWEKYNKWNGIKSIMIKCPCCNIFK